AHDQRTRDLPEHAHPGAWSAPGEGFEITTDRPTGVVPPWPVRAGMLGGAALRVSVLRALAHSPPAAVPGRDHRGERGHRLRPGGAGCLVVARARRPPATARLCAPAARPGHHGTRG